MRIRAALALISVSVTFAGADILNACGDKFILFGRGPRFQHAYAAVHAASILIVMPGGQVKSAAVRDPNLTTALKMAGHTVDIVRLPSDLTDTLNRKRYDMVLAERADAVAIFAIDVPGRLKPTTIAVLESPSKAVIDAAQDQIGCVLAMPQPLFKILNALDDIMQKRIDASRRVTDSSE
jgi:hypothetical protein